MTLEDNKEITNMKNQNTLLTKEFQHKELLTEILEHTKWLIRNAEDDIKKLLYDTSQHKYIIRNTYKLPREKQSELYGSVGWLSCIGQIYDIVQYPDLYTVSFNDDKEKLQQQLNLIQILLYDSAYKDWIPKLDGITIKVNRNMTKATLLSKDNEVIGEYDYDFDIYNTLLILSNLYYNEVILPRTL